jgi:hypothetical protein
MPAIRFSPMRWFAVLLVIVCVLSLALPPDPTVLKNYHISASAFRVVIIFLLVPEALLWYASFYAYTKIKEYTSYIKDSKEGPAFRHICLGMGFLAFGLIVPSIITAPLNYIAQNNSGFKPAAAIISHYMTLLFALVSFSLLRSGSQSLISSDGKSRRGSLLSMRLFAIFFIFLAVFYSFTTLHTRRVANNPYFMSVYPLMVTIIVPYLYAWFEGLVSAYNFWLYSINTRGLLYKKAFMQLSVGLATTIIGFIAVQFITSTIGARTDETLGFVLIIVYILLALLLAGLSLMALGTKKLTKIEEV